MLSFFSFSAAFGTVIFWFVLLDSWVTSLSLTAPCITLYSFPICLLLCSDTDLHEMERCAAFHVRFCYALCNGKFLTEITLLLYPALLFPRCVSMRPACCLTQLVSTPTLSFQSVLVLNHQFMTKVWLYRFQCNRRKRFWERPLEVTCSTSCTKLG